MKMLCIRINKYPFGAPFSEIKLNCRVRGTHQSIPLLKGPVDSSLQLFWVVGFGVYLLPLHKYLA